MAETNTVEWVDERTDDAEPICARLFYETEAIRRALFTLGEDRYVAACAVARATHCATTDYKKHLESCRDALDRLVRCGLVRAVRHARTERRKACSTCDVITSKYQLTSDGHESLRWSAPPVDADRNHAAWAADLVRAIAEHHGVTVSDLLRGSTPGPATVARARLAFALYSRGWSCDRIEQHFAMPPTWARRGVERWKRIRSREMAR